MAQAVKATARICATCKFWSPVSDYDGICTNGEALSGQIDLKESRDTCEKYLHCFDGEELEDYKD